MKPHKASSKRRSSASLLPVAAAALPRVMHSTGRAFLLPLDLWFFKQ